MGNLMPNNDRSGRRSEPKVHVESGFVGSGFIESRFVESRFVESRSVESGSVELRFVEGVSPSMRPVEAVIRELAKGDVPVLLLAEPGAGKQATAERIHQISSRRAHLFRHLECSSLKPNDLESLAGEGTVYFKEVADLSAECQARLQDLWPEITGDGGTSQPGARVICGSARDLETEVKAGRLREDLYYRMSGVCLRLPPVRQRREDIPVLMRHFLGKCAQELGREVPGLSAETQRLFLEYAWPGNLDEMEYAARVVVALGDEKVAMGGLRALLQQTEAAGDGNGNNGAMSLKAASRAASQEAEKNLILKALDRTRWNRRRAARELQISYKALLYKLKRIQCEGLEAS
jgi:two-component system, NtrC family, response regulator AtoC